MLIAEAEQVSINPKLATYVIRVSDEAGQAVALMQGTVYRKQETLDDYIGR